MLNNHGNKETIYYKIFDGNMRGFINCEWDAIYTKMKAAVIPTRMEQLPPPPFSYGIIVTIYYF